MELLRPRMSRVAACHAALVLLTLSPACNSRAPFVVLTVEDPDGIASNFTTLAVGTSLDALSSITPAVRTLPLELTVTAPRSESKALWVEARDATSEVLARGTSTARFRQSGTPTARVTLRRICTRDVDCVNNTYCDGIEFCSSGLCAPGSPPCADNFDCVTSTCVELGDGEGDCAVLVDHSQCSADAYCNPAVGCVQGQGCLTNDDCQDDSLCNGSEECTSFTCRAGDPPTTNDSDACTLDGCSETNGIFHVPQPTWEGRVCQLPSGSADGICITARGGCVLSICGDGYVDANRGELCDDGVSNNDAWSLDRHCNSSCSAYAEHCGDGVTTASETCDDADRNDSFNGCDANCLRNDSCGDAIEQTLFEQCDDGDDDNCDGCRSCHDGCICSDPTSCTQDTRCDQGQCVACSINEQCGATCSACVAPTPVCGANGSGGFVCQCTASPDSCGQGSRCNNGACAPCSSDSLCGQECVSCSGNTPLCGGAEVGCITASCSGQPDYTLCTTVTSPDRSYDVCIGGTCVSPGESAAANPAGPSYANASMPLNDSTQRQCTTNAGFVTCPNAGETYYGQDANYGWDKTNPANSRFTRTILGSDPVVVDNVTGLMWQGCSHGQSGSNCTPGATSLVFAEALAYCDSLPWAGYGDWRLPDIVELLSTVWYGTTQFSPPQSWDESIFVGTATSPPYWSTTFEPSPIAGPQIYAVLYLIGTFSSVAPSSSQYARCVRGPPRPAPSNRLQRGTGPSPVVTDARTGLVWHSCMIGQVFNDGGTSSDPSDDTCTGSPTLATWDQALAACEDSTWNGLGDWRLPNIIEALTIIDFRHGRPYIDATVFPSPPTTLWWTGTPSFSPVLPWYIHVSATENLRTNFESVSTTKAARCVRGPP